jgi:subtilisin family serine protease
MIRRIALLLFAWLSLVGLVPGTALPAWSQAPAAAPDEQRILVMVRLTPEHHRSGVEYGGGYGDGVSRGARERLAQRIARDHGLKLVDGWPMPLLGLDCFIMEVPAGQSTEAMAAKVSQDPGVAWSEPMHVYHGAGEPSSHNDPLFQAQPAAREWRLADLHQLATGRGVTVAVIDTRIEANHPDLAGQVMVNEDFVPGHAAVAEQHGTAVAGIIAAKADNGIGIVGVAPHARLIGLRGCWQLEGGSSMCDSLSLAKALHAAIDRHAQIINLSLSGPPDILLGKLIEIGLTHGTVVVAAFDQKLPKGGFPASYPGVIAVTDESSGVLPPGLVGAPGRDIPTTEPGGRWYLVSGSSFAAAHVSGLMALLRERRPSAGGAALVADGGSIDACASLLRVTGHCSCACARTPEAAVAVRR